MSHILDTCLNIFGLFLVLHLPVNFLFWLTLRLLLLLDQITSGSSAVRLQGTDIPVLGTPLLLLAHAHLRGVQLTVVDLRGVQGMHAPVGAQILSISCSFWENLAKSYVGAPWGVGTPSSGKSWIRHWIRPIHVTLCIQNALLLEPERPINILNDCLKAVVTLHLLNDMTLIPLLFQPIYGWRRTRSAAGCASQVTSLAITSALTDEAGLLYG